MQETFISRSIYNSCFYNSCIHPGTSPVVSFSKIFSIRNTYFQEHLRVFFIFFFFFFFLTAMCQARIYSLCFYLFLQKIRRPVLFSTSWLLLIVIDKFANRNSCGYYFKRFGNLPRERLQWNSHSSCRLPTWGLFIISD